MTKPTAKAKPATVYEGVMWTAFAGFYASLVGLVLVVFNGGGFRANVALLVLCVGTLLGARLAQEIHLSNLLMPAQLTEFPDQDVWEGEPS